MRTSQQAGGQKAGTQIKFTIEDLDRITAAAPLVNRITPMAQKDVNSDFVAKMKKGTDLILQGINPAGQLATYPIQLADFAKANEGPPSDPKEMQAQQEKMQQELQKRAEEARKKLEKQNGAPSAAMPSTGESTFCPLRMVSTSRRPRPCTSPGGPSAPKGSRTTLPSI